MVLTEEEIDWPERIEVGCLDAYRHYSLYYGAWNEKPIGVFDQRKLSQILGKKTIIVSDQYLFGKKRYETSDARFSVIPVLEKTYDDWRKFVTGLPRAARN